MDQDFLLIESHPLLDPRAFVTVFPKPLGELVSSPELLSLLSLDGPGAFHSNDEVRAAVRDLLRYGGFKPTGRSKPASEYLIKTASQEALSSINVAVDACNAASLHSGLPISVIDLDLARKPLRVGIAQQNSAFDADGPCASAVKDSQRSKTIPETHRTLSLIWGTTKLPGRAAETEAWYHELLTASGASIETCATKAC